MADDLLNSRMAEVAFNWLSPVIDKKREAHVQSIKTLFKSGETDSLRYIGEAAAIAELDDLVSFIRSGIRVAKQKEAEVHK